MKKLNNKSSYNHHIFKIYNRKIFQKNLLSISQRKQICKTTNEPGSKTKNVSCQFPFTIGDQTFDACTTEKDHEGKFWCSTKVDRFGIHAEGNWGYCSDDCFATKIQGDLLKRVPFSF